MIFEMFRPVHRWIWCDAERRAHKLLRFGETETDGGRDLVRASETTPDSLLTPRDSRQKRYGSTVAFGMIFENDA